jgi:hypothetical protein
MAINAGKAEVTVVGKFKDEISSKSKKAFDKFKSGAKAAFAAATVAAVAFTAALVAVIKAANEQELAIAKMEGALKATGRFSKAFSADLQKMASEFQAVSTSGDETILVMQSVLLSMGATSENIREVTQASLDLSAGMGVNAKAAVLLFGKALSGDFGTLSRYGISVTDVEGRANKLASALKQVQDKFGGAAQAQAETFGGKMNAISMAFGDMLEEIGFVITKDKELIQVLQDVVKWFVELTQKIKDNRRFLRALGTDIFNDVKKIWEPFRLALVGVLNTFRLIAGASLHIRGIFNELTGDIKEANIMFLESQKMFTALFDSIAPVADGLIGLSRHAEAVVQPLKSMNDGLEKTAEILGMEVYDSLGRGADIGALMESVRGEIQKDIELKKEQFKVAEDFFKTKDLEIKFLGLEEKGKSKLVRLLRMEQELREKLGGKELTPHLLRQVRARFDAQEKLNDSMERQNRIVQFGERIWDNFSDGMIRTLQDGKDMFESFKNVAVAALFDIQSEMLKVAIFDPIKKAAGSFISSAIGNVLGGMFAHGGAVGAGRPVVVGERGPEVFTPTQAGHVTPNNELGGGGVTINQNISVGVAQTVRAEMMSLMPVFIDQAMNVIAEERQRSVAFSARMGV